MHIVPGRTFFSSSAKQRGEVLTVLVAIIFAVGTHLAFKWHIEDAKCLPESCVETQQHRTEKECDR